MNRKLRTAALLAAALVCAIGLVLLLLPSAAVDGALTVLEDLSDKLGEHPVILYGAMVVLPAFFVPQSPMLVLAGLVYAEPMGEVMGALVASSAVALNILWCYFLTVGPLHRVANFFLSKFGFSLPKIPSQDHLKFSFLVRVTPVLPLCIQNYTLGLLRVPLRYYLIASWTTQVPIAFGIAFTAGAILEGNFVIILIAVFVLLLFLFGVKWLRRKLQTDPDLVEVSKEFAAEGGSDSLPSE
ncbi:MAG: VTT domain-containing protein [Verrucomicrobiota bacterium]